MTTGKKLKWLVILFLLLLLAVVLFVKPVRLFFPVLAGLECPEPNICLDNPRRLVQAKRLYVTALLDLESRLGPFESLPRVLFCHTRSCFRRFTDRKARSLAMGKYAVLIGPDAWKTWYVSHEFVHHWQYEKLGWYRFLTLPDWAREGMAYALSRDPRKQLKPPFQQYRQRFRRWYRKIPRTRILEALGKIP